MDPITITISLGFSAVLLLFLCGIGWTAFLFERRRADENHTRMKQAESDAQAMRRAGLEVPGSPPPRPIIPISEIREAFHDSFEPLPGCIGCQEMRGESGQFKEAHITDDVLEKLSDLPQAPDDDYVCDVPGPYLNHIPVGEILRSAKRLDALPPELELFSSGSIDVSSIKIEESE